MSRERACLWNSLFKSKGGRIWPGIWKDGVGAGASCAKVSDWLLWPGCELAEESPCTPGVSQCRIKKEPLCGAAGAGPPTPSLELLP